MNFYRKYFWVALTAARSHLSYLGEVAARTIFLFVILYILLQLWRVTYNEINAQELGGFTLAQMLWYLGITESIAISRPQVAPEVDQDVRTGTLAVQLTRPMSYPFYRLCTTLGERSIRFALNFAVMVGLAVLFVGPIPIHWSSLIGFAVALLLAFVLDFLGTFLVGLGAFWLEDTTGLLLIYSRLTMLLGGMLLPLDLFPTSWQPWLRLLPFSSILYGPAQMFVQPDTADMGALFLRQGIALGVLAGIVAWVYGIAVERIHANGG